MVLEQPTEQVGPDILPPVALRNSIHWDHDVEPSLRQSEGSVLLDNFDRLLRRQKAGPHPQNLLYFGDISGLTIKTLQADLHARYFPKAKAPTDEYIHDLVVQIGVNSQIAKRKMHFFTVGVWLIVLAAVVLSLPVVGMLWQMITQLW